MASGTLSLTNPRDLLFEAILDELRSWADLPRRIFMLVHYSGKSLDEVAVQSGRSAREVSQILEAHERRLRSTLKAFRTV